MSSKPDADRTPRARAVLGGGVIEISGRDAGAFLQAQLMSDLRPLGDGDWQWSGWLTPKGRVVSLAALLRFESERYWLVTLDRAADALASGLQRFVLRSKVTLRVRDDLEMVGRFVAPGGDASGRRFEARPDGARMDWSGERVRTLEIGPAPLGAAEVADADEWAAEDLAHGLPRLPEDASYTPQMLGLDRLGAYSVRKGCYPGQEIVARTHFLGQAKRSLRRLATKQPLAIGTAILSSAGVAGEIVCSASFGARHEALAILGAEAAPLPLQAATTPPTPVLVTGFAEGLAR